MAVRVVRITAGVLLALLLVAGLAVAALALGGAPALRWAIEHPLSRLAGHQINIDGGLNVRWGAPTRITAERIRIANASWGSRPDMLVAERADIAFSPASFLFGHRHLPLMVVDRALLLVERSPGGEGNWSSVLKLVANGGSDGAPILDHVVLRDSRLLFRDMASAAQTDIAVRALELDSATARLSADGRFQQLPVRLAGTARPLADGAPGFGIKLEGTLADSTIDAEGTLDNLLTPKSADLALRAAGRNLQQIAGAFGIPLPALPDYRAEAHLRGGAGNWSLAIASLELGRSDLAGELAIDTRASTPHIQASLTSSLIDSADFIGFLGVMPPSPSPTRRPEKTGPPLVVPSTPVAVKPLLGVDIDLSMTVDAKRFAATLGPPLDALSTVVQLRGGVLTVQKLNFGLAGGSAALTLTLDARREAAALGLDLNFRQVDVRRLVRQAALPPVFNESAGIAGGYAHVRSTGRSLRELLARMDGEAATFLADGQFDAALRRLAAPDVLQALGVEADRGAPVPIACLVAQFELRNGVATARSLMLDTAPSVLVGAGNFNFAAETIYLDLTPHHKQFDPTNLGAPIELRGTFADPEIGISKATILQRLGNWLESDRVAPAPALLPLIQASLGPGNACGQAFKSTTPAEPLSGASRPPGKR